MQFMKLQILDLIQRRKVFGLDLNELRVTVDLQLCRFGSTDIEGKIKKIELASANKCLLRTLTWVSFALLPRKGILIIVSTKENMMHPFHNISTHDYEHNH